MVMPVSNTGSVDDSSTKKRKVENGWREGLPATQGDLHSDALFLVLSMQSIEGLGRCAQVCRRWRREIQDSERATALWRNIVRSQALGKQVWNKVAVVGDVPPYPVVPFDGMCGEQISWREVCKMHKNPSSYRGEEGMVQMPEFDFLVPATINGKPTTINLVREVFANTRLPIICTCPKIFKKYGDIPIERAYWARHTWTVVDDTLGEDPAVREAQIREKGKGLYRLPRVIEMMVFQLLSYLAGIESGYGRAPWALTQCIESKEKNGKEVPVHSGGWKNPVPGEPLCGLYVMIYKGVQRSKDHGAGAIREL